MGITTAEISIRFAVETAFFLFWRVIHRFNGGNYALEYKSSY
jgi:hypothetical protein